MDKKSLERNYRKIEDCVLQGKLKDALDMLKDLVLNSKKGSLLHNMITLMIPMKTC